MGKRTHLTHAVLILGLAALVTQCDCRPEERSSLIPAETRKETPAEVTGQEEPVETIDQEGASKTTDRERTAETKDEDATADAESLKETENVAKEQMEATGNLTVKRLSFGDVLKKSQMIKPFIHMVIEKLASADAKVPTRNLWDKAFKKEDTLKQVRPLTFFKIMVGLLQAVESFRSEDSWWAVVRLVKDLTSDMQWKRLEAVVVAAFERDPENICEALCTSKALMDVLKSSIAEPQCRVEGLNPDPEDCRQYFFCYRLQGRWVSNEIKCPKYTEFSPSRLRCVWAPVSDCVELSDSDEDSNSDKSSRETLDRTLKHVTGAFHTQ